MSNDYLEIKSYLSQLVTMIDLLIPNKISVSHIIENTGKSRQAIHQYLINNFEPEKDFWKEGGKTYIDRKVALELLAKNNVKTMNIAA